MHDSGGTATLPGSHGDGAVVTLNGIQSSSGVSEISAAVEPTTDLAEVFALHAARRTGVSCETRPLAAVNDAIVEVLHGKAKARLVLEP